MSAPVESVEIALVVNGATHRLAVPVRKTLADVLRDDLELTGTHLGCEHGVCGACTVIVDGRSMRSCLLFAAQLDGCAITTVEGLADGDRLHPLQQAFWDEHALQCGFCTPGILLSADELLRDNPSPTDDEIVEAISGHICRCTGYAPIVRAIRATAEREAAAPSRDGSAT